MKQSENLGKLELQMSGTKKSSLSRDRPNTKSKSPVLQQPSALLNKRIVSPQKLKILVLSGNELQNNELQFLSKCINLIKLDLSHNNITRLNDKLGIKKILNLRVLNLESNKILSTQSMDGIFGMESVEVFCYQGNPIGEDSRSEHQVINNFPNLKVINYRVIFLEERDPSMMTVRSLQFITREFEQWQPAEHSERYYLRVLKLQLEYIDNMWMFHNPIVKIQRIWRAVLEDRIDRAKRTLSPPDLQSISNNTNEDRKSVLPLTIIRVYESQSSKNPQQLTSKPILYSYFKQWKFYASSLKAIKSELSQQFYINQHNQEDIIQLQNKQYLTYGLKDYHIIKRNLKIKHQYQRFLKKIRQKIYIRKMAQILRKRICLKVLTFHDSGTSFYGLSGIQSTKKIYFNRVQQHLIENFLAHILKNPNFIQQQYKFGIANQYVAIRLLDPDTYATKTHYNPLTYLMWPCMRSVILKKKKFPFKHKSSIIKIKSLSYIKNLNKHLTPEERKKINKTYQRIDKFIKNQYHEGLSYFYCQNQQLLKQMIRMIYYHNIKAIKYPKIIQRSQMLSLLESYQENVSIYTEFLLERTTSAVKIQQQWRRYINNKRQTETIYEKLKRNRAARLIQRFIRSRTFFHRLSFHRNLEQELKSYEGRDIIVHEQLYKQLQHIIQKMSGYIELYPGLRIINDKELTIYHSQFHLKEVFFPTLRSNHFKSRNLTSSRIPDKKIDVYKFFHFNSQTKIIGCNNQRFYKFTFETVEQAKLRVACFALLTYRMWGKSQLMLLSKSTLENYNSCIKVYKKYGIECIPFENVSNANKLKINVLNDISKQSSCPFLYLNNSYQSRFSKNQLRIKKEIVVEFYQKKFQDFPEKYVSTLSIISQDQGDIKQKEIQEKFIKLQKILIKQTDSDRDHEIIAKQKEQRTRSISEMGRFQKTKLNIVSPIVQITARDSINPFFNDSQLQNQIISQLQNTNKKLTGRTKKTFQKHIILNEIDQQENVFEKVDNNQLKTQKNYRTFMEFKNQEQRNSKVKKFLQTEKQKRLLFREQKQIDLTKIRQKRKKQKLMNMTLKSFNQNERVQILRKKAEQVKEYKRRSLSSGTKDGYEAEFIQQGNFIMEQNLKMNIMRQKLKETEKINDRRKSLPKSLGNTQYLRRQTDDTKSIRSNYSLKQKKIFFEGKDTEIAQIEDKVNELAKLESQSHRQINGRDISQARKKTYVKKKSGRTGAYVRDPSLVHGVFPQEYYPIETSKGGIIFPKVG